MTDGLTAMGMKAQDAGKYADIMAQTMSSSNTTIELMGETMKYAGAVAGGLGISMEDLSLAIGTMANAGIKGSMSGTALRGGLTRLIAPTEKAEGLMKKYGISVQKTADGNVDLRATMVHLQEKLGGLSADTQNMIAKVIFGQTAMNGWLTIINADKDAFNELALAIDTSAGSADRMAETMTDNLWGDLQELSSAVEESLISIFDSIEPILRSFIQNVTNVVLKLTKVFNSLSPTVQKIIVHLTAMTALGAPLLIVFGALMNAIGGVASGAGVLTKAFGKVKTMFTGLDGTVSPFISKIALLGKKMLMLTGIAGAVGVAFGIFYSSMQEDAIESVDAITDSMGGAGKALAEPFIDAKTEIDSVMLQMSNSNVAVTKDMVTQMETSLGNMVNNTVAVMENSQSKVKTVLAKNMKELTGANEKQVNSMKNRVDEIYKEKIKTVQEKEKAVLDIQKKAQEQGRGLLVSEKNEIQQLLNEIQQISLDSMAVMNTELANLERELIENKDSLNAESIGKAVQNAQEKREKIINEANKEYDELINIQKLIGDDLTKEEKSKLDEMIRLAKLRKDNLVQVANDEYSSLIQSARRLAKDSVAEIDWATGEVKTKWQVFTQGFGDGFIKVLGDLSYEWMQLTKWTEKFGLDIDILLLKWQKLWAKGEEKDALQQKIEGLENQKKQIVKLNDEIIKSIDRVQDLPEDISRMAYEIDGALRSGVGVSLADFVHDVGGYLTQAGKDFNKLPIEVQDALTKYDEQLRRAGVAGGLKQLVQYVRGDIKNIRVEFEDLPKSAQSAVSLMEKYFTDSSDALNGLTFEEFVLNAQTAGTDVTKAFEKLPENIKTAMKQIPKEDWKLIMEYYKMSTVEELMDIPEEFKKSGEESGKNFKEGVESTTKENENAGKELGKSTKKGAESTKEENKKAGTELGKSTEEGYKEGLKDLPQAVKDELANAGVVIQQDGSILVQDFKNTGKDAVTGFVGEMNSQLPKLDSVTVQISNRLGGIDNVRLGNVTKQLSEVNRWLGVVQKKAIVTHKSMALLTQLKWGNTTKGLSEVNNWLMRTSNRAKNSRTAMIQLTNLPFGNTTKGLSEVNKWLMRTTNRSKDSQKALKSITGVTFGKTTKGLSEVNKWLTTVRTSSNSAKIALGNISAVRFGGITKGLSEINKWLKTVKSTASGTKSALYAVAQAKSKSFALERPEVNLTQGSYVPEVPSVMARDNWLDFGDITKYKTGGDYYNPTNINSKTNSNNTPNDNNKEVLKTLLEQNQLLIQLLTIDRSINVGVQVDGKQIARASAKYMNTEIEKINSRKSRLSGI